MGREDVVYGSNVGNTTNPQFLEVDNWVQYSIEKPMTITLNHLEIIRLMT